MVSEKEREGDELKASIAESNEESRVNIEMKRRATQNNIMVTECIIWSSQFSQSENRVGEHSEADWDEGEDHAAAGGAQVHLLSEPSCIYKAGSKTSSVSVLGREEGYMVKYGLSPRNCPRAQPKGNPKGSGLILPYIPTWVLIRTLSHS